MASDTPPDGIPFYLMPVAAVVGTYALFGGLRILYLVYANLTPKTGAVVPPNTALTSRNMIILVVTVIGSMLGYAKIVAQVNYAVAQNEYALFDPFEILDLSTAEAANVTMVKAAYRSMSKIHHPDKGGDEDTFSRIHTAYRALTTDRANYDAFGHPDGAVQRQELAFALPNWLLHPQGTVAIVLVLLYLGMFVGLVVVVVRWTKHDEAKRTKDANDMSVAGADSAYLAAMLSPDSSHLDILLAIATTPENIHLTQQALDKVEAMKLERMSEKKKQKASFELDDGGWAEEDDGDDAAKKEEELKQQAKQQLVEASGVGIKLEGVDDGVLGQAWIESTLGARTAWPPPDLRFLGTTKKYMYKGNLVAAMDHPAIRRNLCYTQGRLHSMALNTHTDLLEASSKKLIDPTYFKGSMEYRQRAGLLLEACLRIAVTMQSYRLAKTIVEAVSMFKIGVTDPVADQTLAWFKSVMVKQYGEAGLPRLSITDLKVETPGEDEIATGDLAAITLNMERVHAESFTKVKVAMCQKQGIPPQVALQTYREGWWVLVRAKKVDGGETPRNAAVKASPLLKLLQEADKVKFDQEEGENRLLVAWPMIVQNMAQKSGKVKVQFTAPSVPGKYKILLDVKSQEFLGTDQEFDLTIDVVDVEDVKRAEEEEEDEGGEGEGEDDTEGKKEK